MATPPQNAKPKLRVRDYFRVHIDIPTVVIILLLITICHRSILNWIFQGISFITKNVSYPQWLREVGINVLSEFIAVIILIFIGFLFFKLRSKPYYAGRFTSYQVLEKEERDTLGNVTKDEVKEEWGNLKLTYNIFTNRVKGILVKKDGSSTLLLNGEFDKSRYLRGTYIEQKPSSLRLGAFLMLLDASGDDYSGSFVFLSPDTGIKDATTGFARWIKLK